METQISTHNAETSETPEQQIEVLILVDLQLLEFTFFQPDESERLAINKERYLVEVN